MVFGNWNVDKAGISWIGKGFQRFVIPIEKLNETKPLGDDGAVLYEWIVLATEEDWLTQNDLYDLNYAFVFAIAKAGVEFSYDIFDATLDYQYEIFDGEEDEDPDF